MRVLVTGGAGYVGSHVCSQLKKYGHIPVIVDSLVTGSSLNLHGYEHYICDVMEITSLNLRVDAIIHAAGHKSVAQSFREPSLYRRNVEITQSLIEAFPNTPIVFSSSATVYAPKDNGVYSEDDDTGQPGSPYAESKIECERLLKQRSSSTVILRYFNPVGMDPYLDLSAENLFPSLVRAVLNKTPIHVFGDDYPTDDGTALRDYVYINDLAYAHVRALDYASRMPIRHDVFNIGTGQAQSVRSMINRFFEDNGLSHPIEMMPRRSGDSVITCADPTKSQSLLNLRFSFNPGILKYPFKK